MAKGIVQRIKSALGIDEAVETGVVEYNDGVITFAPTIKKRVFPLNAYRLFSEVSVIFDAVDKIAKKGSSIIPVLKDTDDKIEKSNPLLDVIKNAEASFMSELLISQEITAESWIVARGNIKSVPLELVAVRSYEITQGYTTRLIGGMPEMLYTDSKQDKRPYTRKLYGTQYRYVSADGLNELIPIIGNRYINDWRGLSKLSPLVQETFHITSGNKHNSSVLNNGMTSSIILGPKAEEIEEEDGAELRKVLRENYQGSMNAGKPLILPMPMDLVSQSSSNKDMDYINLIDVDETRIYRVFNIPLALVKSKTMTQSNYTASMPYLYSDAVIPAYTFIMDALTKAMKDRSKLGDFRLTYDKFSIPALQIAQTEQMKALKEVGVLKVDEVRSIGGYEAVSGGDVVLVNGGLIPLENVGVEVTTEYPDDKSIADKLANYEKSFGEEK